MRKNTKGTWPPCLTIDYSLLGTVSFDELIHAIWEDLQIVKDRYNVRYVKGFQLRLPVTDECGERVEVRHPGGPLIHRLHTSHYQPSCRDYEL